MKSRHGSALILAMLFLVLFSGIGVYIISLPVSVGDTLVQYRRTAVARNMADAGVHAAIARFPVEIPEHVPVERRFPIGPGITGAYKVSSRKTSPPPRGSMPGTVPVYEEYIVLSEGGVLGASEGKYRVRALIRYGPIRREVRKGSGGTAPSFSARARIIEWAGSEVR